MRKIKNLFLVITFMFLIGVCWNVNAASFKYYITNSNNYEPINNSEVKSIQRGDTITVTAMLNNVDDVTTYNINSGKLTIRWDDKYLSLQEENGKYYDDSITDISGLSLSSINKSSNKLTIGEIKSTGTLKTKLNKIVQFKFKVLENASSGDFKVYQMDGEDNLKCLTGDEIENCGESSLSELKYSIAKSTINTLSSIKINGMELDSFNENTNNYELEVESNVEKANIEVTKKDSKSTITGSYGENKLVYGENKFSINVVSESGATNTYNITVNRVDGRSSVNTLKSLTLSSGSIKFKPETTEYNIIVENEVDKLTIKSTLTDSKSKYVEDYSNKEIELVEGSNKVEIKVVSEKGEERVYTLNINRSLSSNNSLKSLKINDEKIELKENEFIYNLIVESDVDEVVLKAEANDSKATVKLDSSYPLEEGENEIKVVVVAADGKEASYIINITRSKLLSKDSLLTSLKIKGYELDFKQNITTYDLKVKDEDNELDITTTTEDENATVEIEGNKDLENGSIIKINVKAEDGSFTRYFINVEKGSSGISPIIIIILVLLLLLGLCLGIIFYRKKKKENAKFDKLDQEKNEPIKEEKEEVVENKTSEETPANEEETNLENTLDIERNEELREQVVENNNIEEPIEGKHVLTEESQEPQNKDVE